MSCIKTGCHAYLSQYNEWVYGDAHRFRDILVIRVAERGFKPLAAVKHFTCLDVQAEWNDKPYGTMVVGHWTDHGYDGVDLDG